MMKIKDSLTETHFSINDYDGLLVKHRISTGGMKHQYVPSN